MRALFGVLVWPKNRHRYWTTTKTLFKTIIIPIIFIHWGVKSFWLDHYYIIAVVKGFCGLHQLILWSRLVNKPSVQDGLIEWVTESLAGSLWKNFVSARNRPTCCRFTRVLCLENIRVIWISFMRRRILGYFGACLVFRLCLSYKMHWAGALVGFDVRRRRCHGDMI